MAFILQIFIADAVIARLGQKPAHFKPVLYKQNIQAKIECYGAKKKTLAKKELIGVDVFIDNPNLTPSEIGEKLVAMNTVLKPIIITSRGLKIWPNCMIDAPYANHCSCRFQSSADMSHLSEITHQDIIQLLQQFELAGLDVIKTENLYTFDGKLGFSLAQGQ
jgi:isocitrate dehydrogenase